MSDPTLVIRIATSAPDRSAATALLAEYRAALPEGVRDGQTPLTEPSEPDDGETFYLLAMETGTPAGCVCLHRASSRIAEIKRLYTVPRFRGHGVARELISSAIERARADGCEVVRLD